MTDSPQTTARSSASSRPIRPRKAESRLPVYAILLIDLVLLALGVYLLQEGLAHLASPEVSFFVDFPGWLTYVAGAAVLALVPNFALNFFVLRRGLPARRWPWVTTAVAAALLAVVVAVVGPSDVLTVINPAW